MHVVLYQPEIPQNTGSIARLCAATATPLHLVRPLGFEITDKHLKRAGLDYWPHVDVRLHDSWERFLAIHGDERLLLFSKKASRSYTEARYGEKDFLVFGPETRGLPETLLRQNWENCLTIPMPNENVPSLNLATSVGIVLYEAMRQTSKP